MKFKEVDLDILRGLNENNINDNPSLRDSFFNSLKELEVIQPSNINRLLTEIENVDFIYKDMYTAKKMISCKLAESLCYDLIQCMMYETPIMTLKDGNEVIEIFKDLR